MPQRLGFVPNAAFLCHHCQRAPHFPDWLQKWRRSEMAKWARERKRGRTNWMLSRRGRPRGLRAFPQATVPRMGEVKLALFPRSQFGPSWRSPGESSR